MPHLRGILKTKTRKPAVTLRSDERKSVIKSYRIVSASLLLCGCSLVSSCSTAGVTTEKTGTSIPLEKPSAIYVSDFELPVDRIKDDEFISAAKDEPVKTAAKLVDLMAQSLVKQLGEAGFKASRLVAGAPIPVDGWVVAGQFTVVDEGNRFGRAIGWGLGKTSVKTEVSMSTVLTGQTVTLFALTTEASSGSAPTVGPIGAVAKLAFSQTSLVTNVKQTASKIVASISQRVGAIK